jgi:hypothetical protein
MTVYYQSQSVIVVDIIEYEHVYFENHMKYINT